MTEESVPKSYQQIDTKFRTETDDIQPRSITPESFNADLGTVIETNDTDSTPLTALYYSYQELHRLETAPSEQELKTLKTLKRSLKNEITAINSRLYQELSTQHQDWHKREEAIQHIRRLQDGYVKSDSWLFEKLGKSLDMKFAHDLAKN
jgi:hypothetical protein